MDDIWNCVSLELNIDSIKHRLDYSYSLEIIEGLFLKAYQHGYDARIEIIDRRKVSLREVTEIFQALTGDIAAKEALRESGCTGSPGNPETRRRHVSFEYRSKGSG